MKKKDCGTSTRKHTPIKSEAERGLIGADYARVKRGEEPVTKGMTQTERKMHLKEAAGKRLPARAKKK